MKSTVKVVAKAAPELPTDINALCARLREDPGLLTHWASDCPPEALLAAVLQRPVMWGAVPSEHQGIVQAAAQLLNVVGSTGPGDGALEQPAVKAWLDKAGPEGRVEQLRVLRSVAAGEAVFEVRKRIAACKNLLSEFDTALDLAISSELDKTLSSLQGAAVPAAAPNTGTVGPRAVVAWLRAEMTAAYLMGDEKRSAALRSAVQALDG